MIRSALRPAIRAAVRPALNQHLRGGDPILNAFSADGDTPDFLANFGDTAAQGFFVDGASSTFASAFNFSRSSTATYVDETGTLQTALTDEARTNHHIYVNGAWRRRALFEPEAATNYLAYSNDLSQPVWAKDRALITTVGIDVGAPIPLNQVDSTVGEDAYYFYHEGLNVSTKHTQSLYVKTNGAPWIYLSSTYANHAGRPPSADRRVWINLNTGEVGTKGSTYGEVFAESLGGGVYHIAAVNDPSASGSTLTLWLVGGVEEDNSFKCATDGSMGIYVGGFQLEENPYRTSYIPTAGSTVTRAADTLTIPAANNAYSADGVTIAMRGEMTYADTGIASEVEFLEWQADASNRISLTLDTAGADTGQPTFSQSASGTTDAVTGASGAYSPGIHATFAIASRHSPDDINGAVDGTALTADTSVTALADLDSAGIEIALTGGPMLIDHIAIWSSPGTDARLEDASEVITYS